MDLSISRYIQTDRLAESLNRDTTKGSLTLKFLKVLHHVDKEFDIIKKLSDTKKVAKSLYCLHILECGNEHYSARLEAALDAIDRAVSKGRRYASKLSNLKDVIEQFFISAASEDIADEKSHATGISTFPLNRYFISSYEIKLGRNATPNIHTNYVHSDRSSETPISKICIDKDRNVALIRYQIPERVAELLFNIVSESVVINKYIGPPKTKTQSISGTTERPVSTTVSSSDSATISATTAPSPSPKRNTDVAIVTSSDPVDAQYLTQSKSELYVKLDKVFQTLRRTPEGKVTPTQVSSARFLVYSSKVWKAVTGDTEIPISEISSVDTGSFKGKRITLNLADSKSRSALKEAVKKIYGFEVTIGKTIYIFKIKHVRDGDYFAIPEDPDRENEFAYDANVLSAGCLFFRIEGGTLSQHLYVIDHVPGSAHSSDSSTTVDSSGGGISKDPTNKFEFDEEQFRNIKSDTKTSLDHEHYKLALKFEVCVFSKFAKMAKKEVDAGMALTKVASNHLKDLIYIHKEADMNDATKLNLTIIYLAMARVFSDKLGMSFSDIVDKTASAIDKVDLTKPSTQQVDREAEVCLDKLIKKANSIMGINDGRFVSEKEVAIKAYKSIVDEPNSAIAKYMKLRPQVSKLLVAHLITSAYSIFLSSDKHKSIKVFTEKIVSKF